MFAALLPPVQRPWFEERISLVSRGLLVWLELFDAPHQGLPLAGQPDSVSASFAWITEDFNEAHRCFAMACEATQRINGTRRSRVTEAVPSFNITVCASCGSCFSDGEQDLEVMQIESARIEGINNFQSVGQSIHLHDRSSGVSRGSCAAAP